MSTRTPAASASRRADRPDLTGTVLASPSGRFAVRVVARNVLVGAVLAGAVVLAALASLGYGEAGYGLAEVVRVLGGAPGPAGAEFVILTLRLPRVLAAVLVGLALGVSGAVVQSLTRNPLGSPDVLGFTTGAATGGILHITLVGGTALAVAGGAVLGGVTTALTVYLLAHRGGASGARIVLVGIGVAAILASVNSYLLIRAELDDAHRAAVWLTGSLNGRTWDQVAIVAVAAVLLVPVAAALSRRMSLVEMGDDASKGLGVPVEATRRALLAVAVVLAATAVAVAGPVAFVALAAPHLARLVTRSSGPSVLTAGLVGALLLTGGDLAVRWVFAPVELPVGLATGALGGVYLTWLLAWRWRREGRRGGRR
ncbi:FecCD family ABC transporter permease [Actinoalloteichus caeruleus]|uniref:Iron complex transport system permease protein n=1 Tax=Actinoalloteichus caeruleus DSM 43889 TaxID=1120930 RepID=A0ABT1JGJ6_ACTCY|nr:iron chelate uptake ABC transporter family permease subunit [Actinoalloteichus caeruleus]MCP2331629.1 iron complex transport system permease protein [Actinoalloteichus caeruleus DSM 43889]